MSNQSRHIAFVHDALPYIGGAEKTLMALLEFYPGAPVHSLIYHPHNFVGTCIANRKVYISFLNKLPGAKSNYRNYLPLFPLAIEQFDLSAYELIFSSSYAVAHGVLLQPDQLHISYTYTPLRQAWHAYHSTLKRSNSRINPMLLPARLVLHYFRLWDAVAASRVDHFVAPSQWTAQCIWRAYRREAEVIYPPVDVDRFIPLVPRENYYVALSRLERHKNVDLVVEAFNRLGKPLFVVGSGGEFARISKKANKNVHMLGTQPDSIVRALLGKAKACVTAAVDDFGISTAEAQAAGCPVIAFQGGGVCEIVIDGETGIFYSERNVDSLIQAIQRFEKSGRDFVLARIRSNAERFSKRRFQREMTEFINHKWDLWREQWIDR